METLRQELDTYNSCLEELIKTDLGKFVLIKGDKVYGTYTAVEDALQQGYMNFKDEAFFIKQILIFPVPMKLYNSLLFV